MGRTLLRPRTRSRLLAGVVCATLFAPPAFASASDVAVRFFNSIDIAGFGECSWGDGGRAAENLQVEQTIRTAVEKELTRLGYRMSEGAAPCRVSTQAIRDQAFPVGMLVVEVRDGASGQLAWRAEVTELVNRSPKQVLKLVRKIVKKMFKFFPKARVAGGG